MSTQTETTTAITDFLTSLSAERRPEVEQVRELIRRHLPEGYEEVVSKNTLVYQVPFARYSDTYNRQPLWYVALASQKSYLSLHLVPVYGSPALAQQLAEGFQATGKKLNMGKACIHFKKAEELALDVIGEIVAKLPPERWIELHKTLHQR